MYVSQRSTRIPTASPSFSTSFSLLLLFAAQWLVFFGDPRHFFQADTLYWLYRRYHSIGEFISGFFNLDNGGWYRPLTNRLVQSLLFPVVGLDPLPYRLFTFALFCACTYAVFVFVHRLTESRGASWIATLFFAFHTVNAFTTYDVAFTPEIAYTLCCIGSTAAYITYLQTRHRTALITSVLLFVVGLFSKETAVTLPVLLLATHVVLKPQQQASWLDSLRSMSAHFLILAVYLVFVVGYLGVGGVDVTEIFRQPDVAIPSSYTVAVTPQTMLLNLDIAASWLFNLPRGWHGDFQRAEPWMIEFGRVFRILTCGLLVLALFTKWRRVVLFGLIWMVVTLSPALPLTDHFLPYYIFGPLVGLAISIGCSFEAARLALPKRDRSAGTLAIAILLALVASSNAYAIANVQRDHPLLGDSSALAVRSINDLRALRPHIGSNTTLIFLDDDDPGLNGAHGQAGLWPMLYNDDTVRAEYSSLGIPEPTDETGARRVLVFRTLRGHLHDVTREALNAPELLLPVQADERHQLRLSTYVVRIGGDSYSLSVSGMSNIAVRIMYSLDDRTLETFDAWLDESGTIEFPVSEDARPGTYRFIGVKPVEQDYWFKANASLVVLPSSF